MLPNRRSLPGEGRLGRCVGFRVARRCPAPVTIYRHLLTGARRRLGDTRHRVLSVPAGSTHKSARRKGWGQRRSGYACSVDARDLRIQGANEVLELGVEPTQPRKHKIWLAKRRAAMVRLAEFADHDALLLRDAATGSLVDAATRDLLLDAIRECDPSDEIPVPV
jgi:hypothetical protein